MAYRILNLYACLGGNRYKWDEVAEENSMEIEVTAVEWDPELARLYQERFPNDKVVVADAHEYLLHNRDFDFVWSSPPCPTHSLLYHSQKNTKTFNPRYPDLKLYEEILFLDNFFDGMYCVENVQPYYQPLIPAKKRGRHLYWTNFHLPKDIGERKNFQGFCVGKNEIDGLCKFHDYDFHKYKGEQRKDKIARNLVDYEVGKKILQIALGIEIAKDVKQMKMEF